MATPTSSSALPDAPLPFVLHVLWRYRWWYVLIFVLEVGASASGIMLPYAIGQVVGTVTEQAAAGASADYALLSYPLALFLGFNVAELLFARSAGACRIHLGPLQRTGVIRSLYHVLQQHSHRYISNNFAGSLAARISETSTGVNMTLITVFFEFLPLMITLLVSVALLFTASPALALFTLGWAVAFIGISYVLARRCQPYAQRHAEARSNTTGQVVDAVSNLSSIRLFARLKHEQENLDRYLNTEVATGRRSLRYNEKIQWFQFSAAVVLKAGVLLFALHLWNAGAIDLAAFVMSVSLTLLIIGEARNLSRRFLELFEYIGNIANGVHAIILPHEIVDAPDAKPLQVTRGAIELRGVGFGYTPESRLFKGLNLRIEPGQRVGLVGFSGSGKSTLISLILRMYDPQEGSVLIDGTDIRDVTQESLHAQIGLIPQDPGLFHRSLYENIGYGRPEATREDVEAASRRANAHDFIESMDERYEALVGERGVKLSGGQRQRIAIARIIVKNAPILIMDEATSSLDSITERMIQNSLDDVMRGKTVIVVAHRLSTIAHLDRIVVFDRGRVVEDGAHAELLARRGAYWQLWQQQLDGFLDDGGASSKSPSSFHDRSAGTTPTFSSLAHADA